MRSVARGLIKIGVSEGTPIFLNYLVQFNPVESDREGTIKTSFLAYEFNIERD